VRPLGDPIKKDSHLVVLYGNLAPEGAVAKITGKEGLRFEGPARVFDSEEASLQGILAARSKPATWWSSATKDRRAVPGCAKC
jgi:dihydroxy-acid dehydratase